MSDQPQPDPYQSLILWSQAIQLLTRLPRRRRAQLIARWTGQLSAISPRQPPRRWRFAPEPHQVRIIGDAP